MGKIIELKEYKDAKEKIKNLKNNLEELILERDNLKYVICENIKASYLTSFGSLEYNIYEAYCKYLRLRRKKEMIQEKINRQEKIDLEQIEKRLDEEFIEYNKRLDDMLAEINDSIRHSSLKTLSDEDTKLIKKIYKDIIKKIHPDINPKITDAQKELFYTATQLYEDGDLEALKMIYEIVSSDDIDDDISIPIKTLKEEIKRLENLVDDIKEDIELIKTTTPYTWRVYLYDEDKKNEKIKEMNQKLISYKEAIKTQEDYINQIIRG